MTTHWLPDPQRFAVDQERWRHDQAVYQHGEYVIFCLLWRIRDFQAGLVTRCSLCFVAGDKIAATYGQPTQERCVACFGTTFQGGYKALIVRPVMWNSTEETETESQRGITIVSKANVQTVSGFDVTNGDYIFRGDGTRWQLAVRDASDPLITGFEMQGALNNMGTSMDATREDESSVAYMIPPSTYDVQRYLDVSRLHFPTDFSDLEVIRAPLLPGDESVIGEGGFAAPWNYPPPVVPDDNQEAEDIAFSDWAPYSPFAGMPTPPTVGNGSISGKTTSVGKTVTFEAEFVIGSTTVIHEGVVTFALPRPALRTQWLQLVIGMGPTHTPQPVVVEISPLLDRVVVEVAFQTFPGNFFALSGTYEAA